MNVSGLVVTFDDRIDTTDTCQAIAAAGPFTLGERFGPHRLTLALEAPDDRAAADWHDWLAGLPGVVKVDVAFVHFFDPEEGSEHVV